MLKKPRLALLGAGRMGGALLRGWADHGGFEPAGSVLVIDPKEPTEMIELLQQNNARFCMQPDRDLLSKLDVLVLAIKPQLFDVVAKDIAAVLPKNVCILSVIAGISLERIADVFGPGSHARAMPNTAAEVGKSISVLCCNAQVGTEEKQRISQLLQAVGEVEEIEDERLLDVVTAVSGSGPAYFFLLAEVLAAAGQAEGLSPALAEKLARQTMIGAGALLQGRTQSPMELRAEVTSPGGTTAAALDVMMGNGAFADMMRTAVSAAARRGRSIA